MNIISTFLQCPRIVYSLRLKFEHEQALTYSEFIAFKCSIQTFNQTQTSSVFIESHRRDCIKNVNELIQRYRIGCIAFTVRKEKLSSALVINILIKLRKIIHEEFT